MQKRADNPNQERDEKSIHQRDHFGARKMRRRNLVGAHDKVVQAAEETDQYAGEPDQSAPEKRRQHRAASGYEPIISPGNVQQTFRQPVDEARYSPKQRNAKKRRGSDEKNFGGTRHPAVRTVVAIEVC